MAKNLVFGFYLYYISYIVASYHCMQFQEKLMNQTWEDGKKPLVLGPMLAQIWDKKIFFLGFTSTTMYNNIVASYHCM